MPGKHTHRRGTPKPICKREGCQNRVKSWGNVYCSPECVPRSVRVDNCRRGRKTYAYRRRAMLFREDLEALGQTVTREALLGVLARVYRRAYHSGYRVGLLAGANGDTTALEAAKERGAA